MACRGVHFALTADDVQHLLAAVGDDDAVLEFIQEDIEERWDEDWLQETDKAWDAIHRCLTDGSLSFDAITPRHKCILGGRQMYSGDDYIISFLTSDEVREVAQAIAPFGEAELRDRYFKIDEEDYGVPVSDQDFEYTWGWFEPLKAFFVKAADAGRPVVFSVDQ
jgi:hypothetical protein